MYCWTQAARELSGTIIPVNTSSSSGPAQSQRPPSTDKLDFCVTTYKAEDILKNLPDSMVNLSNRLRITILERTPDCEEATIPAARMIHYILHGSRYIPGPFLALAPTARSVTLHFLHGDQLNDPDRLLEGHGGRLRTLKLVNDTDAYHPGIIGLIESARDLRKR
jgi:hypothetical protein